MIILGIDPGFRYCGYGILKKEPHKTYLIDHGCLSMSPSKSLAARIQIFYDFYSGKIEHCSVTNLAIETPFLGKNAQNFLKLGYLRGILYLLSAQNNLSIHEFSPCQIKLSVTGFGGASKNQVARVIFQLFPKINKTTLRDDVTDAIAITLCGLWNNKLNVLR